MYYLFILALFFLVFFYYLIMKKRKLNQLTTLLKGKNKQQVREFCDQKINHVFLSKFILDLYMAKSLLIQPSIDELKEHLQGMFEKTYAKDEEREYLTLYYHYFTIKNDKDFAMQILERIQKTEDISLKKYSNWTKAVLFEDHTDLIQEMDEAIQRKEFSGFALAVVCYLIAYQYEAINDVKLAIAWYENAESILQPKELYADLVKEKLKTLPMSIVDEEPTAIE